MRSTALLGSLILAGCKPVDVPRGLASAQIERAWVEDYSWTALGIIGGGLDGDAWLYALDAQGELHEQYVELRGGLVGFAFEYTMGGDRTVELNLPPGPTTGADLFERYSGSFEAFVVGFGFASLHLKNEHGVELDDQGVGALLGLSISAAWLQLVPAEPPPEPDTADSADSQPPEDTGDTRTKDETGDSGDSGTHLTRGWHVPASSRRPVSPRGQNQSGEVLPDSHANPGGGPEGARERDRRRVGSRSPTPRQYSS